MERYESSGSLELIDSVFQVALYAVQSTGRTSFMAPFSIQKIIFSTARFRRGEYLKVSAVLTRSDTDCVDIDASVSQNKDGIRMSLTRLTMVTTTSEMFVDTPLWFL